MNLKATCHKAPSCSAFVIVEDVDHKFATTMVEFTGTHADTLADAFIAAISGAPGPLSWWQRFISLFKF